jgi:hypothetical protein
MMGMYWGQGSGSLPNQTRDDRKPEDIQLLIEPVVSWRMWKLRYCKRGVFLHSITYNMRWLRKKPVHAHCLHRLLNRSSTLPFHLAPDEEHGCGIYSVDTWEQALEWRRSAGALFALGRVKTWGRVLDYTEGYVSEYAYPLDLYVCELKDEAGKTLLEGRSLEELAFDLLEAYAVPVGWMTKDGPTI